MRLVFAGTPEVAIPSLEAIESSGHELLAVVTRPDAPAGRGRKAQRSAVGAWADNRGIEVLAPQRPSDTEFCERLRALNPDCVPVVAYGALVPSEVLEIPAHGWVNLHFSLLPAWRGAAPVQHAVLHGDQLTGACVFALETGLDTGPVYGSVTEPIGPRDTSGDLLARLAGSGARLLADVLDAIASGVAKAVPQVADGISMAPKMTSEEAQIRWDAPAFAIDRRVRAVTPSPGAWTTWDGQRVRVGPLDPDADVANAAALEPGAVVVEKNAVYVGTGTHPVKLGQIQAPGKKRMAAADWARGLSTREGIVFS